MDSKDEIEEFVDATMQVSSASEGWCKKDMLINTRI